MITVKGVRATTADNSIDSNDKPIKTKTRALNTAGSGKRRDEKVGADHGQKERSSTTQARKRCETRNAVATPIACKKKSVSDQDLVT